MSGFLNMPRFHSLRIKQSEVPKGTIIQQLTAYYLTSSKLWAQYEYSHYKNNWNVELTRICLFNGDDSFKLTSSAPVENIIYHERGYSNTILVGANNCKKKKFFWWCWIDAIVQIFQYLIRSKSVSCFRSITSSLVGALNI